MRTRLVCTIAGVTLAGVAVGYLSIAAVRHDPHDALLRASMAEEPSTPPPGGIFSPEHHETMARIVNDLGRRSKWTADDTRFALALIGPWPDEPIPTEADRDGLEAFMEWDQMMGIMAARVGWEIPTDQAAADRFQAAVVSMFHHPQPHARRTAISLAYSAGMLDENRSIVERLRRDPDAGVRDMAARKLAALDGAPEPLDCPTCPKGDQP